jgi:hypothetical protein
MVILRIGGKVPNNRKLLTPSVETSPISNIGIGHALTSGWLAGFPASLSLCGERRPGRLGFTHDFPDFGEMSPGLVFHMFPNPPFQGGDM